MASAIVVQISQAQDQLYILLESSTVPAIQPVVEVILPILSRLNFLQLAQVTIYARQQGVPFTSWHYQLQPDSRNAETATPIFPTLSPTAPDEASFRVERIIVCGLGSLGQHCVSALTQFARDELDVRITAIDRQPPQDWEVDDLISQLDAPVIAGDCRRDQVLEKADIRTCQSILIVTNDDSTNIETAIAARRLNLTANIVIKSGQKNLNELLKDRLGNFVALESIDLPISTLSLAALGDCVISYLSNSLNYQ